MSRATPPCLTVTDARATHKLKEACVTQIAVFVTSGFVAASVSSTRSLTQGFHMHRCSRPWPLQGVQMSRKRPSGRRLRSCQLSQSFGDTGRGHQIST